MITALALLATPAAAQDGLAAWEEVHAVLSHPRCANCHVGSDGIPVWSGPSYGSVPRRHGMNIAAGDSRIGAGTLPCQTCHTAQNGTVPHAPPGNPVWMLPPVEMQWWNRTSGQICAQLKDPARNGGRDLDQIIAHVAEDELVHWGWTPGPGRQPAPGTVDQAVAALTRWAEAGAPCPDP